MKLKEAESVYGGVLSDFKKVCRRFINSSAGV